MSSKTRAIERVALVPVVLLVMGLISTASGAHPDKGDAQFVAIASSGGLAEVRLGELAQQRGSSQTVKDFGKRMVDDHTVANRKLQMVAGKEKMDISADLTPGDRATYAKLNNLLGPTFDRAYAVEMVNDHQKDIAEFEKEAKYGKDPAVRQLAQETLPSLRQHLELAQQMEKAVASSGGT